MSKVKSSQTGGLSLINIILLKETFERNMHHKPKGKSLIPPSCFAETSHTMKNGDLVCTLTFKLADESNDGPFILELSYQATYRYEKKTEIDLKVFANEVAPAHLFPYVREGISALTSRSGFPALVLPPMNIARLLKQNKIKPIHP